MGRQAMRSARLRRVLSLGLTAGILTWGAATEGRAATVAAGYDLFATTEGTTFPGLGPLVGVPLGTFDFNNGKGAVWTGDTDTIVHRLDSVTGVPLNPPDDFPAEGTTRLEMLALQLKTATPIDFGGLGLDTYYITLQSARGGPATVGSMTITFASDDGGTFSSFFDVFFDIRKGSLDGQIVFSDSLRLTNDDTPWDRDPPPGALLIDQVNHHLNGVDNTQDFWPIPPIIEQHPNGAVHAVTIAQTPEPASWLAGLTAVAVGLGCARRRRAA
jgi:hypothetical protein